MAAAAVAAPLIPPLDAIPQIANIFQIQPSNRFLGKFQGSLHPYIENHAIHERLKLTGSARSRETHIFSAEGAIIQDRENWERDEEHQVQSYTSLIKAAYDGNMHEVLTILSGNPQAINERSLGGRSALHAACAQGHQDIAEILINTHGLNKDALDNQGISPLRLAVAGNRYGVVLYLLQRGAHVDEADNAGWTPLHSAALNGQTNVVHLLTTYGADVANKTIRGYTPLFLTVFNGHLECAEELLTKREFQNEESFKKQLKICDENGVSPLHCAAFKGRDDFCKFLLEEGADASLKTAQGALAIQLAMNEGHLHCVRRLTRLMWEDEDDLQASLLAFMQGATSHPTIMRYIFNWTDAATWSDIHFAAWDDCPQDIKKAPVEDIDSESPLNGSTPLLLAVWQGHTACVETLIEKGADINKGDSSGCSPLHIAVESDNLELVVYLIEKGADVHMVDKEGRTALHTACLLGNKDIIDLLLHIGLDVNTKITREDATLHTPLQLAAMKGHEECVRYLVEKGALVESLDGPKHYSAMLAAASKNHQAILEYLLSKGASLHAIDEQGFTLLIWAACSNNVGLMRRCLDAGVDMEVKNSSGQTALHVAGGFGHSEAAKLLVEAGAVVDAMDNEGCTPLANAAEGNHSATASYLLDSGANIETADKDGNTPLHWAASFQNLECIKLLVDHDAQVNVQTLEGCTPLHLATGEPMGDTDLEFLYQLGMSFLQGNRHERNHVECLEYLLDHGACIDMADKYGHTPFMYAADIGVLDVAELLLSRGANIDAQSVHGTSALHIAARTDRVDIIHLILREDENSTGDVKANRLAAKDHNKWTPLQAAVDNKHLKCVEALCDHGADIETTSISGKTPLHRAAENNSKDIVKVLLAKGADIDARELLRNYNALHIAADKGSEDALAVLINFVIRNERSGGDEGAEANASLPMHFLLDSTVSSNDWTPLHCAVQQNKLGCIRLLCDAGCNLNAPSTSGKTPLHRAVEINKRDVIDFLLGRGADVNKANKAGWTALHLAALHGFSEGLDLLLQYHPNVNAQAKDGSTSLHVACRDGCLEFVWVLIAHGANVNAQTNNGAAPIHFAAERDHTEVIGTLVENGALADIVNKSGRAALHSAACLGHPAALCCLLQKGANINAQTNHNSTPLLSAAQYGHLNCVEHLVEKGADLTKRNNDGDSVVHVAASGGKDETLEYLLQLPSLMDALTSPNNRGRIPLHEAASQGFKTCVEILIAIGADIEVEGFKLVSLPDREGKTPPHLAAEGGHVPVIEILVDSGSDVNLTTQDGQTCLHLAVKHCLARTPEKETGGVKETHELASEGDSLSKGVNLALYLIGKGASLTVHDQHGLTPLQYARTSRLWEALVSTIDEEEREEILKAMEIKSMDIRRTVVKAIGKEGGELHLEEYDVHMFIPPGALDEAHDISLKLLTDPPDVELRDDEVCPTFGIAFGPSSLTFKQPFKLTMPHCILLDSPEDAKPVLLHKTGQNETERVRLNEKDTPMCTVREHDLELYLTSFCHIHVLFDWWAGRKRIKCTQYVDPEQWDWLLLFTDALKGLQVDEELKETSECFKRISRLQLEILFKHKSKLLRIYHFVNGKELKVKNIDEYNIRGIMVNRLKFSIKDVKKEKQVFRVFQELPDVIEESVPAMYIDETDRTQEPNTDSKEEKEHSKTLSDDEIYELCEKIPYKKYYKISIKLGYEYNKSNSILTKHGNDSNMALTEIFQMWKSKVGAPRDELKVYMKECEIGWVFDKCFSKKEQASVAQT